MHVSEVMTQSPEFVTPQTPIGEVAQRMRFRDVGSLPVCEAPENPRLLGIVTDRDIAIRAVADLRDGATTPVGEIMSTQVQSCRAEEDVERCAGVMQSHQVRRIPVIDQDEKLVGMVSLGDLAVRPETAPFSAQGLTQISIDWKRPIRERAFQLWQQEGSPVGGDLEYWTRAEAMLAQEGQRMAA